MLKEIIYRNIYLHNRWDHLSILYDVLLQIQESKMEEILNELKTKIELMYLDSCPTVDQYYKVLRFNNAYNGCLPK